MSAWVDALTAFIAAHPHWTGGLVFLVAAAEAVVLAGYIIPGTAILLSIGGLAGAGHLPLLPILAWAAAGAVAGDGFSYWLGHTYQEGLRRQWPFSRYPGLIDRGEAFFHRHGGKSILLGRFIPVLKPIIPTVAGILGMSPARFYAANIMSALLWSPAHILPGAVVGVSLGALHGVSGRLVLVLLGVIALLVLAVWAGRAAVLWLAPALASAHRRAFAWAMARPGTAAYRLASPFDPDNPATPGLLIALTILVGASITFASVLEAVVSRDQLVMADRAISHFVSGLRNAWADPVMIAVTALGDAAVTAPLAVLLVAWLAAMRRWRLMLATVIALGAAGLAVVSLKAIVHVPRPAAMYSGVDAFAFPSGHTTMAATLYGLAAWIVAGGSTQAVRITAYAVSFGWVAAIAISRVYLGAHWPSDSLAGMLIGAAVCATVATFYRHAPRERLHAAALVAVFAAVCVGAGAWHVASSYPAQASRYAPREIATSLDVQLWWGGGAVDLPEFRVDLAGEQEEPLSVQWLGGPAPLRQALMLSGWKKPPPWTLDSAVGFLKPNAPIDTLPVSTKLNNGAKPVITLVRQRHAPGTREVFRAWNCAFVGTRGGVTLPMLVGSALREYIAHPGQMLSVPVTSAAVDPATIELPGVSMHRISAAGAETLRASIVRLDKATRERTAH